MIKKYDFPWKYFDFAWGLSTAASNLRLVTYLLLISTEAPIIPLKYLSDTKYSANELVVPFRREIFVRKEIDTLVPAARLAFKVKTNQRGFSLCVREA